ncbi:hypothetical protein AVEN_211026-1 [Araneus ventricosus]|uniref:Uncharacterized protein n=1 Tax=Araneus ventricosus TaxID=182803 RepID=A0A4Y2TYN0_ARAVE|nr:hypothetical protein AVEN_211026-1 [Araneus ventricosus]
MRTSNSLKTSLRSQNKCALISVLGGKGLAILRRTKLSLYRKPQINHFVHNNKTLEEIIQTRSARNEADALRRARERLDQCHDSLNLRRENMLNSQIEMNIFELTIANIVYCVLFGHTHNILFRVHADPAKGAKHVTSRRSAHHLAHFVLANILGALNRQFGSISCLTMVDALCILGELQRQEPEYANLVGNACGLYNCEVSAIRK